MLNVWFVNEEAIVCTIVPAKEVEGEAISDGLLFNGEPVAG